jgi:primosomal protein N' (replication factor Y)
MDLDTTGTRGAHDRILETFRRGEADILLGTQMIAKGLDFEKVNLVGVISADIGLNMPDYRAVERIFQLLTQVAGRAGRRKKEGEVVIQTNLGNHYAIQYASNHDYLNFYEKEISYRKELSYPPFSRLINIKISADSYTKAMSVANQIKKEINIKNNELYKVIGPSVAPIAKVKNMYRWQIMVKINLKIDPNCNKTKNIIGHKLETYISKSRGQVKVALDVDPMEMM